MSCSARRDDPRDRLRRQGIEDHDLAAGEQRAVQLEGRVLGRGADQDDVAGFDVRQEDVLLRAVEAVDLVEEEDRALARARLRRLRAPSSTSRISLTPVATAEYDRNVEARLRRDEPRQRRLADARRPPEDERRDAVLGDRAPQEAVRPPRPPRAPRPRRATAAASGRPAGVSGGEHLRGLARRADRGRTGRVTRKPTPGARPALLGADGQPLVAAARRHGEAAVDPGAADGIAHHFACDRSAAGRNRAGAAPGRREARAGRAGRAKTRNRTERPGP